MPEKWHQSVMPGATERGFISVLGAVSGEMSGWRSIWEKRQRPAFFEAVEHRNTARAFHCFVSLCQVLAFQCQCCKEIPYNDKQVTVPCANARD